MRVVLLAIATLFPTGLPEGAAKGRLPAGTREGLNDWKRTGYGGPCPPIGRYALVGTYQKGQ